MFNTSFYQICTDKVLINVSEMSEDEVESFEITDYDLENEFNINRPRRKLSKKQQMLGKFFVLITITSIQYNIKLIFFSYFIFQVFGAMIATKMNYLLDHRLKHLIKDQRIIRLL